MPLWCGAFYFAPSPVLRFILNNGGDPCGNFSLSCLPWLNMPLSAPWKCPLCSSVAFGKRIFLYKFFGPYSYIGWLFSSAYIAFKKAFSVSFFPGSWGQNHTPSGNSLYRTQEWGTGRLAPAEKVTPGGWVSAASFRDMTYPGRFILVKSFIPAHCQTVKKSKSNRGILQENRGLAVVISKGKTILPVPGVSGLATPPRRPARV